MSRGRAVALLLVALNLRMAIAAVSPLLSTIERSTGLSSAAAGLLGTVPVVCFGAAALTTTALLRRIPMNRLLLLTVVVLLCGIALRLAPSLVALFAGTAVLGSGIAVANVVVPGLIKRDFAGAVGPMTGAYSVMLFVSAAIPAGLTVPVEHGLRIGWREALAVWGVFAVAAILGWSPFAGGRDVIARAAGPEAGTNGHAEAEDGPRSLRRDRVAWLVTSFMGLQSLGYYATLSWLPTIFESHGVGTSHAGWLLSFSAFPGMAAALAAPMTFRWVRPPVLVGASAVAMGIAYAGLIADPVPLAYLWMVLLGAGQGIALALALRFIIDRSPDTAHAARLSTMAQGTGYLVASLGPFALGALHGLTGGWTVPLCALIVVLVPLAVGGLGASRDRFVLAGGDRSVLQRSESTPDD